MPTIEVIGAGGCEAQIDKAAAASFITASGATRACSRLPTRDEAEQSSLAVQRGRLWTLDCTREAGPHWRRMSPCRRIPGTP